MFRLYFKNSKNLNLEHFTDTCGVQYECMIMNIVRSSKAAPAGCILAVFILEDELFVQTDDYELLATFAPLLRCS